jgi:hypothetical protein
LEKDMLKVRHIPLLVALLTGPSAITGSVLKNGTPLALTEPHFNTSDIENLVVNGDWTSFTFGNTGTTVSTTFLFSSAKDVDLFVTDAFCPGDAFNVFEDATFIGNTAPKPVKNCDRPITDPNQALFDADFSSGAFFFKKGTHRIQMTVAKAAVAAGGSAFITAQEAKSTCSPPSSDFAVSRSAATFNQSIQGCDAIDAQPAKMSNIKVLKAATTVINCLGFGAKVWIKSFDRLATSPGWCWVLTTSPSGFQGSVNPEPCNSNLPALCEFV